MKQGALRLIAKTYLLLLSWPAEGSEVSPDEKPKKKRCLLHNGHPANNRNLNSVNNRRDRESEL